MPDPRQDHVEQDQVEVLSFENAERAVDRLRR